MTFLVHGTAAAVERALTPAPEHPLSPGRPLREFADSIGVPIAEHQAEALRLTAPVTAIVAPRQAGKSRSVSVLALHRSLNFANHHTLIVSAGESAAKRVLALIARMALDADPSGVQLAREPTHDLIELTNGSTIRCVPASEKRIRGWTIDLLIIDEAALVADDLILSAAMPTTVARPHARTVLVSSALLAAGAFYRFVMDGRGTDAHIQSFRWTLEQCPWISRAVIEAARKSMPPAKFAAEFLAEFPDSGVGLLIPRPWIAGAQSRELPGRARGAFGVDVARSGVDFTTIYRNRGGVVREVARVHGQDTMTTANQVAALLRAVPSAPAVVDVIGIGAGVVDRLSELALRVVAFNAGARARKPDRFVNRRAEVYWALRVAFEDGLIDICPTDIELADELADLRYEVVSKGRIQMESKDDIRDRGLPSPDRADAIAMCVAAAPMELVGMGELGARAPVKPRLPGRVPRSLRVSRGDVAAVRDRPM